MYIMREMVIIGIGIIGTITIGTIRTITIGTMGTIETKQIIFKKLFAGERREVSQWIKFYVAPIRV